MHHGVPERTFDERVTLGEAGTGLSLVAGIGGLLLVAIGAVLGWLRGDEWKYFLHSYLVQFCFFLSLSLGALVFVAIQHATRAGWSASLRRLAEILGANAGVMALLFLPILVIVLMGNHSLYEWADPSHVAEDHLLQHKQPYLNVPFFIGRAAVYFLFWWVAGRFYLSRSVAQDSSGDPALTLQMERWSGPIIILFALTVTFAAFDWLMSLDPHWYSTIYGVYYFAGAIVSFVGAITLIAVLLQSTGRLTTAIHVEHYHDLGKLLLAFVIFWGYIAFSQYMLIWYGNIPEETIWYLARQTGPWGYVSLALLFGHLLIPFFGLLPRMMKRRKMLLAGWGVWILAFHWLDIYWLVMPRLGADGFPPGLIDLSLLLGTGGLYLAGLIRVAGAHSLVALRDPRLAEALAFENV